LVKKNVEFRFGSNENNALKSLKNILLSEPVLAIYSSQLLIELYYNASVDVGAILLYKQLDGTLLFISYFSH